MKHKKCEACGFDSKEQFDKYNVDVSWWFLKVRNLDMILCKDCFRKITSNNKGKVHQASYNIALERNQEFKAKELKVSP